MVLLSGCGTSSTSPTTTSRAPTTTTTSSPPTTTTTDTTTPTAALQTAVWPTAASSTRYVTPVAAATSFAIEYVHMTHPTVGAFRQGDARSGEVPVQPNPSGPVTTVLVRQLDSTGSWWVLGAATSAITLTEPAWNTVISSPLTLRGMSMAFEGTVQTQVRADDVTAPLATSYVTGGSTAMGPFSGSLPFTRASATSGAVVLLTTSAEDGSVRQATVLRVRFG